MAKKKIDPTVRARAKDLLRAGKSTEEIIALTGLSRTTVNSWRHHVAPESSPASAGASSAGAGTVKVEAVPVPPGGGDPPKGGGGYDAAKAAAAGAGGEKGPPPPGAKTEPQVDPVLALIMTSDLALSVATRFYALRLKVKWSPELEKFSHLSDGEKSTLLMYGPFVAPFLSEFLLKYGKYVGPAIYGLAFYQMVLGRFATVKDMAPPPEKKKDEPAAPPPQVEGVGS